MPEKFNSFVYPSGWRIGERFRYIGGNRKYNSHIYIEVGSIGTIEEPPNSGFPADAVQVRINGGSGGLDVAAIERLDFPNEQKEGRRMTELDEILPQYCPDCGAGAQKVGEGLLCRVPRNFPFDVPCAECERRNRILAMQAGAKVAMERERRLLEAVWGELLDTSRADSIT